MRTIMTGAIGAAFALTLAAPAFAKTETIKGQVVDQMCYLKDKANNSGKDHKMPADVKGCAEACAKKGQPLALLTADGKLYMIAGGLAADNNAKLVPHISHTVEIAGDVTLKDGKMTITAANLKMVSAS